MLINSIILYNYRLYKGINQISFSLDNEKNIFLIAGENGFGKTTFLTSLIWCLYGKQMVDVENTFRKDFSNNGGYPDYLLNNLNKNQKEIFDSLAIKPETINKIKKYGYSLDTEYLLQYSQYYISIDFTEMYIPSVPCNSVTITRRFDIIREEENVDILIDGKINELSTEIGPDIFINDFILNKDIARFFFFDSEKIVSLAENYSISEKRKLSSAYNEVLGVKKYEDLKRNLENLRIRLRKKTSDIESRNKLTDLLNSQFVLQSLHSDHERMIKSLDDEIFTLKKNDDELQMQLLREGNSMTLENIKRQQQVFETVQKKDLEYKSQMKEMLDNVPFAIAGNAFLQAKIQADKDISALQTSNNAKSHNELLKSVYQTLSAKINRSKMTESQKEMFSEMTHTSFEQFYKDELSDSQNAVLLEMTKEQHLEFQAIYSNLTTTFKLEFKRLTDDYRKNRQLLERTARQISNVQSNENDSLIKKIRKEKNEIETLVKHKEQEIRSLFEKSGSTSKELNTISHKISELSKIVSIDDSDAQKDEVAKCLIAELDTFLFSLKSEKKFSLEKRIKETMNSLMHKEDFISDVKVDIFGDMIEINLLDSSKTIINKESLSKGEQQLYATSILKSLVDESGTQFPVFIDSPLQKFDKRHSRKIISEFYPNISKQVILFPLLFKELTEEEYEFMQPKVKDVIIIQNDGDSSCFQKVEPGKLFKD